MHDLMFPAANVLLERFQNMARHLLENDTSDREFARFHEVVRERVTIQSGIGRGWTTENVMDEIHRRNPSICSFLTAGGT